MPSANQIINEVHDFQDDLNLNYGDKEESPLTDEDLNAFKGLQFFEIDTSYYVIAKFVETPNTAPFKMKTTTDRLPIYRKFGEAHFQLQGKDQVLSIFQNLGLMEDPEYEDYLFVPFTDETNGSESYGGGRYLDVEMPEGDRMIINFNKAYNPYCAYNAKYSCPIPPSENHLDIEIKAGVKAYDKH
ncbi:DUF1684 domain-containing protein [Spongiivirga citrea]|uniref:DUF1684 domain-containing protein n=2 Tax=Spongiivirga citrea TaxID=1481457 RepID=A0A6M0CKV2_9FLAO|nr:DUF1684 domain-containing protein [Spongiivirga citrea]